jgi:4-amino-4-deoxy-L-arabinose transferase-like glycosyltransferase
VYLLREKLISKNKNLKGIKSELFVITLIVISAILLRQIMHVRIFPDSIDYLTFARNIMSGIHNTGYITLDAYRRPPLYPHLVSLFSFGNKNPLFLAEVARQVSVICGTLLVFPMFFLGRDMFGKTAAIAVALFTALTPEFIYYSGAVLTESTGVLFVSLSILSLWKISVQPSENVNAGRVKKNCILCLVTGILLGLSFLARHALIGYLAIALVWFSLSQLIKSRERSNELPVLKNTGAGACLILAGFFLIILPQILYLHSETGHWSLAIDSISPAHRLEHGGEDTRYTASYEQALAELAPDNEHFLYEVESLPGLFSLLFHQTGPYLKAYFATLIGGYLPDTYPLPYPIIILIFGGIGIIGLFWKKKFQELLFCMWGFGGYYLFMSLFLNLRDRYLFPSYPFILILSAAGVVTVVRIVPESLKKEEKQKKVQRLLSLALFLLITGTLLSSSIALINKQNTMFKNDFFVFIGKEISKKIKTPATIFDRVPHIPYFSGGIAISPPYAAIKDVITFARKRGVDYWIVSNSYVPRMRPQYLPLLNPYKKHEGLSPIFVNRSREGYILIVYKIVP